MKKIRQIRSSSTPKQAGGGPAAPPLRGIPLGWRLALYTSLGVTSIMGFVTVSQHRREIRTERALRQEVLKKALAPLVLRIERAAGLRELRQELSAFHHAYVRAGYSDHQLEVRDSGGRVVAATRTGPPTNPENFFRASLPVLSPALPGGRGTLEVWEDASAFHAKVSREWRSWWLHIGITLSSISIFLLLIVRYLVAKPLERLMDGLRRMEMGYWEEAPIPGGAWEIRWLAWRFRSMGVELRKTVNQLVEAERRSLHLRSSEAGDRDGAPRKARRKPKAAGGASAPDGLSRRLREKCRKLDLMSPRSRAAKSAARDLWERDAPAVERFGDWRLKTRVENAALRVLNPDAFSRLENQVGAFRDSLGRWMEEREAELLKALDRSRIPYLNVSRRIKHTAGIWKKMRAKGLSLEQVHDLVAFRVVVPTEPDCYWTLGVVHRTFEPVFGRFNDYISDPKKNGYQSLHTCVRGGEGRIFEIQIRSAAMHRKAEKGSAAHWLYKADLSAPAATPPALLGRLRNLLEVMK